MQDSNQKFLDDIIQLAVKNNASDIHLTGSMPPILRILGQLRRIDIEPLDNDDLSKLFLSMLNDRQIEYFKENNEIDFAMERENLSRFRVNFFQHIGGISGAFRLIRQDIRSLQELQLPDMLQKMVFRKKGLILVTGPTGSGKSTTLAGMIHEINTYNRDHIITIEDPIEYLHKPIKSMIHQREVGMHVKDFPMALRSALREDPDVILVGEMRDMVTVTNALRAAETGHLVLSTLHTNSAADTIDRIVNVFPAENQQQVKQLLASTLISVISQRLVPRAYEQNMIAVTEILINTDAVKNLIREGKTHQIDSAIQTGFDQGMQTFERSLSILKQNNMVQSNLEIESLI